MLYSVLVFSIFPFKSCYKGDEEEFIGIVTKYNIDGNKLTVNLKCRETIISNYYFKTEQEKNYFIKNLNLGDELKITGTLSKPSNNTIPNLFNYKNYLYQNKIYYTLKATYIEKSKNNTSLFYFIKNKIIKRIEKIDKTGYLKTFILGDKTDLDEIALNNYQNNGISHLFAISGMHINLIILVIMKFLNKVSYNNKFKYSILNLILIFYLYLTDLSASILRTTIMVIIASIDKCFNLKINKFDIMLLTLIVAIIIDPFIIYKVGFQFSYIISTTLVLINKKLKNIKNKFYNNLYVSFICFIISFPICIYYYYQVNIFSILFNLIMIPIVSVIIFPLSIITFIFPFFYNVFELSIKILEFLNEFLSNIELGVIYFSKPSLIVISIYYLVIYVSLFKKKFFLILIVLISMHKLYPIFDNSFSFIALDVGQGDSLLLRFPNNKANILIDTGGIISYKKEKWKQNKKEYSLVKEKLINYFKSIGIARLDYLILTHGDYDHMGEAINLVENFKVEKVIFNCGEFNELEQDLMKVLDKKKIPYYSCIKELNIDNNKLYFLNNKDYGNENNNSSVIYTELNNYKFLFMGDAGVEVEEDLIEKYNLNDIDVLKVGHHGSKTSSNKMFIDEINPKYSIISVGDNNRYGHPNKEVLKNLKDSKIYRTDKQGSIIFEISNNQLNIDTCNP